jgi:cytochrome c-type biogenesis protein CcmE
MKENRKRKKWVIGGGIIIACIILISFVSLKEYSVYFYTPQEAFAQAPALHKNEIRVGGMVKLGSVEWDRKSLQLQFVLTDFKGAEIAVKHRGTPPDMFKENSGVVVEGQISSDGHAFSASKLMVKHSEEYKKPDSMHSVDKALLEQSMFKNERL